MAVELISEPVSETGGLLADGARRLLGAPDKERLEIFVREAIQNSWDARLQNTRRPLGFELELRTLQEDQRKFLVEDVLGGNFPEGVPPLADPLRVLVVSDFYARGLGGPLNPQTATDQPSDFVNFVYMIGKSKEGAAAGVTGGNQGYGKSSYFGASLAQTVLTYTRTQSSGGIQTRFIGMAWGDKYAKQQRNYTGRHWWGKRGRRGHAEPLKGTAAERVGEKLGLPKGRDGAQGSTFFILDPDLGDRAPEDVCRFLESCVLWNVWPRIVSGDITFRMKLNGELQQAVDPENHPRVKYFARALKHLDESEEEVKENNLVIRPLRSHRPDRLLGKIALVKAPFFPHDTEDPVAPVEGKEPLRHVAFMRGTRLIIRYQRVDLPQDEFQCAGVFVADEGMNEILASSEGPAHDDWVKEKLNDKNDRSLVNRVKKRVKETASQFFLEGETQTPQGDESPLGSVSDLLGSLLLGSDAQGTGRRAAAQPSQSRAGPGGGQRRGKVEVLPRVLAQGAEGNLNVRIPFRLEGCDSDEPVWITARVRVLVSGGGGGKIQ